VEVPKPETRFKLTDESRSPSYTKSVAMLQSLGPVQDQPIDLSLRSGIRSKTIKHRRRKDSKGHVSSEENLEDQDELGSGSGDGVESCDDERGMEDENEHLEHRGGDADIRKPISTPLDLTTRT
jgi:hypothetical protein